MAPPRRRQFYATLLLMIVGAAAELMTIGAALPFLALISGTDQAAEIRAVRFVFDLLGWRPGDDLIVPATLLLVGAAVLAGAVRLLLTWTTNAFVFRFGHDIGVAIFSRLLRQPYLYHINRNSSRAIAGVEKVEAALFSVLLPVMQAVVAGFMSIFIIAVLLAIDPLMAAIAAATMAALYVGLSLSVQKLLRSNSRIASQAHTLRIKQVQEGLGGIRDILIDRSQPVFEKAFSDLDVRLRRAQMVNNFLVTAPRMVIEAAAIVTIALLALYMSGQPGGVVRAIPVLGALAIGAQRLLPLLQAIYSAWSRTAGSLGILFDLLDMIGRPLPPIERCASEQAQALDSRIEFDRVSFAFPGGRAPALRDVSLCIRKGERIGLVGETGSGKSTLLDLLMGLLNPTGGEIRVDGEPMDEAMRIRWQAQIAHVPQFIYLADASIVENIAFGSAPSEIDRERVHVAAQRAQIAEFIQGLPNGYDTRVGERGVRLSGGQRQRIGIARALYKRASLLILDEATSALDDETEASVIRSLSETADGLTLLMVAHRLTTLAACDRLIRLKAGRVTAQGSYSELVGRAPLIAGRRS